MQAELQERSNPDGENQGPQVDESVMEVEVTDESTISEIVVSPVSNIIDI